MKSANLLLMCLAFTLLAGCGDDKQTASSAGKDSTSAVTQMVEAETVTPTAVQTMASDTTEAALSTDMAMDAADSTIGEQVDTLKEAMQEEVTEATDDVNSVASMESAAMAAAELAAEEAALAAAKLAAEQSATIAGASIQFEIDSAELTAEARQTLEPVIQILQDSPSINGLIINGHADSAGPDEYNQTLSQARAQSVADYLMSFGVNIEMTTQGMGESAPVADNETDEGRAQNRRVELEAIQ